jgi:AraC-like DNA-binding protein
MTEPICRVRLRPAPFSPWLRLAHVTTVPPGPPPTRHALRTLRDFEWFFQLDGAGGIVLPDRGGHVPLPAGTCALIPPGLRHGWIHDPGSHLAVHFDLHAQPALEPMAMLAPTGETAARGPALTDARWELALGDERLMVPLAVPLPDPPRWRARLQPLLDQYATRRHRGAAACIAAAGILGAMLTEWLDLAAGTGPDPLLALLVAEAAGPGRGIPDLAKRAGLGQTAFRAAVQARTGLPPRRYLERLRLERAAYALQATDLPVARIGEDCGYPDPFHFSRAFTRVFGCSPRGWRQGRNLKS